MTDIIIYTASQTLEHKKGGDGFQEYFWSLPRTPKRFKQGDKIYFACNGFIEGYFICESFDLEDKGIIVWSKDSWVELKHKIPSNSFQGFKYADKVAELYGVSS